MPTTLRLNCLIEGEDIVFTITAEGDDNVSNLKDKIKKECAVTFEGVDARRLELWKVNIDIKAYLNDGRSLSHLKLENLEPESIKPLQSWMSISKYWSGQPPDEFIHIIVKGAPAGTIEAKITPSSSQKSNLFQASPPAWLVEIHEKLWGKSHLFGQIFRTANLTEADFTELQLRLESNDPSRSHPSYKAKDVLKIKAKFLREKSSGATAKFDSAPKLIPSVAPASTMSTPPYTMDIDSTTYRGDCDSLANAPSTSKTRPSTPPVLDDAMNVDADAKADPARQPANCPDYIIADAEELSRGSTTAFPCIIRYMDLTILELKHELRVKSLTLIRDEWDAMIDMFNCRKQGITGSAIFTGSPGIGKTCLLYYILILCLIQAQPVVFQDMCGDVYLITNEVRSQPQDVTVHGDDVLTLIDAEGEICKPYKYILRADNLRILLMSSPRHRADRRWLRQIAQDEWAVYLMSPWSQNEWLVASLFIVEQDITLDRFWKTFDLCGSIPRQFLHAVQSPKDWEDVQTQITSAIQACKDIKVAVNSIVGDEALPHRAFVAYPSDKYWRWDGGIVKAISKRAMNIIIEILDKRSAEAAFNLYKSMRGYSFAASFRGNLWERKVHGYLPWCTGSSKIRSLDGTPDGQLDLSEGVKYFAFGPPQVLSGKIADSVDARKSVYLQPISDNFESLDSIIYQPNGPLIGIQITNASKHPIKTEGLKALQSLLSPKNASLSPLRPNSEKPWFIIFVVPKPMEKSFTRQPITGDASDTWSGKTVQYVLGLDEGNVFGAQFRDERKGDE